MSRFHPMKLEFLVRSESVPPNKIFVWIVSHFVDCIVTHQRNINLILVLWWCKTGHNVEFSIQCMPTDNQDKQTQWCLKPCLNFRQRRPFIGIHHAWILVTERHSSEHIQPIFSINKVDRLEGHRHYTTLYSCSTDRTASSPAAYRLKC